jgi:uncharacterized Zn finger protein
VLAQVEGSETYRVRLRSSGGDRRQQFTADCTCPAFEREGWCKHLVAVALAANAAGDDLPDRCAAIRAHLVGLGAEALAGMLIEIAADDPALMRRLDLAASAAATPAEKHAAKLRESLAEVLRPRRFVEYDEAGGWTSEVLEVLDQVPALIASGAAGEARALLESVLDDLPEALEQVDDSDGGGMQILERAAELHLEACTALRPPPEELAEELFERAWDDSFGAFGDAAATYAEVLGEAGLARFRALAEKAHARLPAIPRGGQDPKAGDRRRLTAMLDWFAEREGDLDRRIALRRAALAHASDYLELGRFCVAHGRPELALRVAEEGAWLFDEGPRAGDLVLFLAERLVAEGRSEDARAALWKSFERSPSFAEYKAIRALPGGGSDAKDTDRALAAIAAKRGKPARGPDQWRIAALAEVEFDILMAEGRLAEAWALTRTHRLPEHRVLKLAEASETALPEEAAAAYRAAAERQIAQTNRGGYEEACRLLARLAKLEAREAHAVFVTELRTRSRAKRTLLPLLDRHLASVTKGR